MNQCGNAIPLLYGCAEVPLYLFIQIEKRASEPAGKQPANRGLAHAAHADEKNPHRLRPLGHRRFARSMKVGSGSFGASDTISSNPAMNPFLR